jgi:hypothetical protein
MLQSVNGEHAPARRHNLRQGSVDRAAARHRAAVKYYEHHVLAWYALDRVTEARAATQAIVRYRRVLAAEATRNGPPRSGAAGVIPLAKPQSKPTGQ